jgi:multiple sugar transport system ATP-binding protein
MVATFLGNPPMNVLSAVYQGNGFDVSGQLLSIPPDVQGNLNLTPGQSFNLGIRPEHIYINEPQRRREASALGGFPDLKQLAQRREEEGGELMVEVKVVEPLGRETLIRASLPGSSVLLNVQVGGGVRLHPGDRMKLQLDLNQLFIFDSSTGETLYPLM